MARVVLTATWPIANNSYEIVPPIEDDNMTGDVSRTRKEQETLHATAVTTSQPLKLIPSVRLRVLA